MTVSRSYRGSGIAKAILFYWPGTSKELAESLEDEIGNRERPDDAKESAILISNWLREKLGAPIK